MRWRAEILLALVAPVALAQRTIKVWPAAGAPVAAALRQAHAGDTVWLSAGVYREPMLVVDKPLVITGDRDAILDGARATDILRILADDVTVRGLTFRTVTPSHVEDRAAIHAGEVRRCRILENRIQNAYFGIYLAGSRSCLVEGNTLQANGATEDGSGNGIHLWTARDVTVRGNVIAGHRDGIYLEFTHDSRIADNESRDNIRYGLHFMYSDDCAYERNRFHDNGAGVAVMYTHRVSMSGNTFSHNLGPAAYGLLLKEVYDAHLSANRFEGNTAGLVADGAGRVVVSDNRFEDNGWAVRLLASSDSAVFTGNEFRRNSFDVSTNSRQSNAVLRGNYWDAYRGYDLDRDGIGDVPHRPVSLFSLVVERYQPVMALMRSPLVQLLDGAERAFPSLTPPTLEDRAPHMRPRR
jgi:nitrous oxidase accessory protein